MKLIIIKSLSDRKISGYDPTGAGPFAWAAAVAATAAAAAAAAAGLGIEGGFDGGLLL